MPAQSRLETKPQVAPWQWGLASVMLVMWCGYFIILMASKYAEAGKPLPQWMTDWGAPLEPALPYLMWPVLFYLLVLMVPALWIKFTHPKKKNEGIYIKDLDQGENGVTRRSVVFVKKPFSKKNISEALTIFAIVALCLLIFAYGMNAFIIIMKYIDPILAPYGAYYNIVLIILSGIGIYRTENNAIIAKNLNDSNRILKLCYTYIQFIILIYISISI